MIEYVFLIVSAKPLTARDYSFVTLRIIPSDSMRISGPRSSLPFPSVFATAFISAKILHN